MPLRTVGIEEGRNNLPQLAARANAGEPSLLTKHGKPYAAIMPPDALARARPKTRFLRLRGTGKGLWGPDAAGFVAALRQEWGDR